MTTENKIAPLGKEHSFAKLYLTLREREGRLYTDAELASLPDVSPAHLHAKEWAVRKRSSGNLLGYLAKKEKTLTILEVGCGNGWLSHLLAGLRSAEVTGLDVNGVELEQAGRVFGNRANLRFLQGDPFNAALTPQRYDVIVMAASAQYFPSLTGIIDRCLQLLYPGGELHLLDTHFYRPKEAVLARQRSAEYFDSIGCPLMLAFYHHHLLDDLLPYRHRLLYDPQALVNKLYNKAHPFYWICVYK